jgi:hypothetical protein
MATTVGPFRNVWYTRKPHTRPPDLNTKEKIRRALILMLSRDESRPRPPISLAGQPAALAAPPPPPASMVNLHAREARGKHNGRSLGSVEGDALGPYTAAELRAMNDAFVSAVEHAFRSGRENREAARRNGRGPLRSLGS